LVVEVVTVEQDTSVDALFKAGPSSNGKEKELAKEKEKEENRKKVRVCRECLNTVLYVLLHPCIYRNETDEVDV